MLLRILPIVVTGAAAVVTVGLAWKTGLFPRLRERREAFFARAFSTGAAIEVDRRLAAYKIDLFSGLEELKRSRKDGKIILVEVGCGSCENFRYYPPGTEAICVDVNRHFEQYITEKSALFPNVRVIGFHVADAGDLTEVLEDGVADAAVVTETLCSVTNVDHTLAEIRRVLKPGGKLFFLEHVLASPEYPFIRLIQRVLHPVWKILFNGCSPCRPTGEHILRAGFSSVELQQLEVHEFTEPTKLFFAARLLRCHVVGTATK